MGRSVNLAEAEYERAFMRWQYTPRWRVVARLVRRLEWKLWLHAMIQEINKENKV